MKRPKVTVRRDGMVLIRPRRLSDAALVRDGAALALLLVVLTALTIGFTTALVKAPMLVGLLGGCTVLGLLSVQWGRGEAVFDTAPVTDPPPRNVA